MRFAAWLVALAVALPGSARAAEAVDLELVLSVDSSGSIDNVEFDLQRRGYAEALVHPEVLAAIRSGPNKAIALTFVEWSGPGIQQEVVGWTRIASEADARAVSTQIRTTRRTIFGGGTGVGSAITAAFGRLEASAYRAKRRIIDISGDGFNNKGPRPDGPRDLAVAGGVVINGLTVGDPDGWLTEYYERSVIGGQGAFVLEAQDFQDFERAVVRKLIREIYVSDTRAGPALSAPPAGPPQRAAPRAGSRSPPP